MGLSVRTRGGATLAGLAALLLAGGAVGCGKGDAAAERTPAQMLTVAYEKTAEAKSAQVRMTLKAPGEMTGGEELTMSGVMGWDPSVMDVTVEGYAEPGMPEKIRMIWRDDIMYMDGGQEIAKDMGGKRWMKLDIGAAAEASGEEELAQQLTGALDPMNQQSPAEQIALLLESPNLRHLGSEKIGGVEAEHYKGTLTVAEMMKGNTSLELLKPKEREQLLKNLEKSGIKGYDTEIWVDEDDLPVRMDVGMDTPGGDVEMSMTFSDYGTDAEVEVPPAGETFDLMEMFKELGESGGFDESAVGEDTLDLEGLDSSPSVDAG
ncbi:hypothetical protein [Streptomyces sp. enrichment culture]|uniref:hypothetical protein n=1 Tax=Streptomyces sp. enrichment culture TaxID=1795815 RepID=UPI003F57892A